MNKNIIKDDYYNIKDGIFNTIKWLPIIWQDKDWDDYYFHRIMRFKLSKMEKFFRSDYCWGADSKKDADNIKYTVDLLDRIIDNVYLDEAMKPFNEKYPNHKHRFEFEPCENNPKLHKMINKDTEDQKQLRHECYNKADELEKKDLDELYKFLREHIKEWWD